MRLKWSSGSTARRSTFPARRFRSIAMAADRCATTSTWASTPIAELRWMPSAPGQSLNWSAANGWSSSASWTTASQSTWPKRRSTRLAWTPKTICSGWKRSCVEGLSERLSFDRLVFARPRLGRSNPLPNRRMRVEKPFDELRRLALSEILVGELLHRANEGRDRGNVFPGITIGLALMSARDCVQSGHQQKTEDRYNQHDERQVRKVVESRIEHGKPVPRDHKTKHLVTSQKPKNVIPTCTKMLFRMWRRTWCPSSWARMASISSSVQCSSRVSERMIRRVEPRPVSAAFAFLDFSDSFHS